MLHYQEDVPNTNIVLELGEADFRVGLESGAEEEVGQGGRWSAVEVKQAICLNLLVWWEEREREGPGRCICWLVSARAFECHQWVILH